MKRLLLGSIALCATFQPAVARAVDPFEIQVYDGTSDPAGEPAIELHVNRVMNGVRSAPAPELPSHHQSHFTLEPSFGVSEIWELGAYLQSALLADGSFEFAGAKLRSKLVTPPGWHEHVRLGINVELSYLPAKFEPSRTGMELRPIVAWENERWLFALNPIVGVAFGEPGRSEGPELEPALMALFKWPELLSAGLEYYSGLGPVAHGFAPWGQQAHYVFEVINLLSIEHVELNFGIGQGLTHASDPLIVKLIAGYGWGARARATTNDTQVTLTCKQGSRHDDVVRYMQPVLMLAMLACSSTSTTPQNEPAAGNPGSGGTGAQNGTGGASSTRTNDGTGGANNTAGTGGGAHSSGGGGSNATAGTGGARQTPGTDAGSTAIDAGADAGTSTSTALALPPVNAGLDYQLGGAYPPPDGVKIVSRDRTESPAPGLYNICYVNGFQIQPGEESFWNTQHPELVLRDSGGNPVVDSDWNETLIDVSTPDKRSAVAAVIGEWIAGCKDDGFDAVEIDNLDSYSRSSGLLSEDDAVAAIALFSAAAHAAGLAIAQKNSAELVSRRAEMDTDFAVAEECNRYSECDTYTGAYGDHVLVIEYRRSDFTTGCSAFPNLSIVLRDLDLTTPSDAAYVYDGC